MARASSNVGQSSTQDARSAYQSWKNYADESQSSDLTRTMEKGVSYLEKQGMQRADAEAVMARAVNQTGLTGSVGFSAFGNGVTGQDSQAVALSANKDSSLNTHEGREKALSEIQKLTSSVSNTIRQGFGSESGRQAMRTATTGFTTSDQETFTGALNAMKTHSDTISATNTASQSVGFEAQVVPAVMGQQLQRNGDRTAINAISSLGLDKNYQDNVALYSGHMPLGQAQQAAAVATLANNASMPGAASTLADILKTNSGVVTSPMQAPEKINSGAVSAATGQASGLLNRADSALAQPPVAAPSPMAAPGMPRAPANQPGATSLPTYTGATKSGGTGGRATHGGSSSVGGGGGGLPPSMPSGNPFQSDFDNRDLNPDNKFVPPKMQTKEDAKYIADRVEPGNSAAAIVGNAVKPVTNMAERARAGASANQQRAAKDAQTRRESVQRMASSLPPK